MKKIVLILFTVLVYAVGNTQTLSENYIKTTVYQKGVQESQLGGLSQDDTQINISYVDGIGRVKQSIAIRAGGQYQDVVNTVLYDSYGRQGKTISSICSILFKWSYPSKRFE